ncbi:MAG TPA: ABC transporter ATP-binding protein [Candidatus Marinimicrobia bacterium]|nr:ABC transporter ATP-binding protein [Candidatus Neomarinimicrobiota bacterium]
MTGKIIIETKSLVKQFSMAESFFTALDSIDFTMNEGEFTGLIGPSGSGKTTLLNIIGSLDKPSKGEALVLGESIGTLSAKASAALRNRSIGFIFQNFNLLPVYTVYENVEFPLLLLGVEAEERRVMVEEALRWVDLLDKRNSRPGQISGGQAQRVAIARAMVKKPRLVLADEPTANLDAANSHHILQTMKKLNEDLGTTFLFSTHDEKVMTYLKRRIFLVDGKIDRDERV